MSTRGALGFKINGKYKVTYNHFDSYPGGLGHDIVKFCRKVISDNGLSTLKECVNNLKMADSDSIPSSQEIEMYKQYSDTGVSSGKLTEWYVLLRHVQGAESLEEIYHKRLFHMIDSFNFLKDSLFCEYAYIINLDDETLEFYQGFNESVQNDNPLPFEQVSIRNYYPVRFKGSCSISEIPDNWEKIYYKEEEE